LISTGRWRSAPVSYCLLHRNGFICFASGYGFYKVGREPILQAYEVANTSEAMNAATLHLNQDEIDEQKL